MRACVHLDQVLIKWHVCSMYNRGVHGEFVTCVMTTHPIENKKNAFIERTTNKSPRCLEMGKAQNVLVNEPFSRDEHNPILPFPRTQQHAQDGMSHKYKGGHIQQETDFGVVVVVVVRAIIIIIQAVRVKALTGNLKTNIRT